MPAADPDAEPFDALQAWLTLLPAAALAWPGAGALLADVPTTVSAGTGWVALLTLPAIVLLALRRRPVAFAGSTLLLGVLALVSATATTAGDPFEARRVVLTLTGALALVLCGASLQDAGRRVLLRGLALISVLLLLGAAFDRAGGYGGALGNTGHTAQAALPGAVCGLAACTVLVGAAGWIRIAWGAAGLGLALYAGRVPVLAGALGLAAATAVALLASPGRPGTARAARVLLLATLVTALAYGARELAPAADAGSASTTTAARDLGGVEFRWRTWRAAPAMLADSWLLGVGPGQFAREYPPHRDPVERELSSHGGREPTPIEVEHAHNDWLEGLLEFGLPGGLAWLGLLLLAARAGWQALRSPDATRAGLGAAAIAVLAGALVHAPLLASPAAPAVCWPLLGAVLTRPPARGRGATFARLLPALAALLLLVRAGPAWGFLRHGQALAGLARLPRLEAAGFEGLLAADVRPHLAAALRACPDSTVALEKRDEWLRATHAPSAERIDTLTRLLAARPQRFAALLNLGVVLAEAGRHAEARAHFARAAQLEPGNTSLARNRLLLAYESFDEQAMVAHALELLDDPAADPAVERRWMRGLAARLLLAGRLGQGQALLLQVDATLDLTSDQQRAYARAQELDGKPGEQDLADAAFVVARVLWGRRDVEHGAYETAVRNFRQAAQIARRYDDLPGGDALVRLELAAALALAGRSDDAAQEVRAASPNARQWARLPAWAGQALIDAGLFGATE